VAAGDTAALQATVNALRALAAPASDPDRGEEKAADYLQGLRQLQGGDSAAAVTSLQASVQAKGYEFDVYALALARALAKQGNAREARTLARQASGRGGAADLRPRACAQALRNLEAELNPAVGGRGVQRLRVRIGDDEIHALDIGTHHVGDGIAASTTDADDTDSRTKFVDFRPDEIDAHRNIPPQAHLAR
jgi:hypothetical protein